MSGSGNGELGAGAEDLSVALKNLEKLLGDFPHLGRKGCASREHGEP